MLPPAMMLLILLFSLGIVYAAHAAACQRITLIDFVVIFLSYSYAAYAYVMPLLYYAELRQRITPLRYTISCHAAMISCCRHAC